MQMYFGFEELEVWKKAIDFADHVINLTENIETNRKHFRLVEQLEAASTSIAMNIAEGKGRYSKKEFIQFLYISRGSLYECITLLIIFKKRSWISEQELSNLEADAKEIACMLTGLIKSIRKTLSSFTLELYVCPWQR